MAESRPSAGPVSARHAASPRRLAQLELNAITLMATTAITALVGVAFWAVAARLYPASEVGRSSAILTSATLIGALSTIGLGNVYARFLASAGRRARSLVGQGYLAVTVVALIAGLVFLVLAPAKALLPGGIDRITFPIMVIVLALFALQDEILVGLRAPGWVAAENVTFAIVKLALLIGFAHVTTTKGIPLAWTLPAVAAVAVIGMVLRSLTGRSEAEPTLPPGRELRRFAAGEYLTGVLTEIVPLVLPLIVVTELGTVANAYLAVPWMIGTAMNMFFWNISASLIAEAAHNEAQAPVLMRRALRLCAFFGVTSAVVLIAAAPWLLDLLGGAYSDKGSGVVRLIAAGLPFTVVVMSYMSMARINRQIGRVVLLQALTAVMIIGFTCGLISHLGIDAVGWGYFCGQAAAAAVVIVPLVRGIRGGSTRASSHSTPTKTPESSAAVLAEDVA